MLLLRVSPVLLWLDKMPKRMTSVSGKMFKRSHGFAVGARVGKLAFTLEVNSVPKSTYTPTDVTTLMRQENNMDWAGPVEYPAPKVCSPKTGCGTSVRINPTFYAEVAALREELVKAKDAHAEYEKVMGITDTNWPDWYARYILAHRSVPSVPKRSCPEVGYCK